LRRRNAGEVERCGSRLGFQCLDLRRQNCSGSNQRGVCRDKVAGLGGHVGHKCVEGVLVAHDVVQLSFDNGDPLEHEFEQEPDADHSSAPG
jgi:hypothetical protein